MNHLCNEAKLKAQLEYTLAQSDFYRNKFGPVTATEAFERFEELPFTGKKEILADESSFPPFGSNLCVSKESVVRVHKTSGTTNKPVLIALTRQDIEQVITVGGDCFRQCGLSPSDTVVHCLNYNMWAGGVTDHMSLEQTGAAVIPFGVGNTSNLIRTILDLQVTAIHCTPSYLSKIQQILEEEYHLQPKDLHLRLGLLGAESGLQNPDFRKRIEHIWGFKAMNANYGMSEVLSMIASECKHQNGLHFRAMDALYFELIDGEGHSLPMRPGTEGEMVFTNLCKEAQPLIRYRTGDVARITGTDCECGYHGLLFEIVGRCDDMIVVKGLNVFVSAIEQVIQKFFADITTEYRVLVSKSDPIEHIIIQVESLETGERHRTNLAVEIASALKREININCEVQVLPEQTLPRTSGKTKRLLRIL